VNESRPEGWKKVFGKHPVLRGAGGSNLSSSSDESSLQGNFCGSRQRKPEPVVRGWSLVERHIGVASGCSRRHSRPSSAGPIPFRRGQHKQAASPDRIRQEQRTEPGRAPSGSVQPITRTPRGSALDSPKAAVWRVGVRAPAWR